MKQSTPTYSAQILAGAFLVTIAAVIWRMAADEPVSQALSVALAIVAASTMLTAAGTHGIERARHRQDQHTRI